MLTIQAVIELQQEPQEQQLQQRQSSRGHLTYHNQQLRQLVVQQQPITTHTDHVQLTLITSAGLTVCGRTSLEQEQFPTVQLRRHRNMSILINIMAFIMLVNRTILFRSSIFNRF